MKMLRMVEMMLFFPICDLSEQNSVAAINAFGPDLIVAYVFWILAIF